jgi:ribosomal protein S27E
MMAESKNESLRASCPDCKCDVFLPLMGIWINMSFQGNRLRMIWPDRAEDDKEEFANVACPKCGNVLVVHADGRIVRSGNKMFSGNMAPSKKKQKASRV